MKTSVTPRPRVVIVGGGVYVPTLCALLERALPPGEVVLTARRIERLQAIAARARTRCPVWEVTVAETFEGALDGASDVVLLVRVGGLAARAHDERFPLEVGVQGDEGLGPGGYANAWRSVPVLARMAEEMRARAPSARVWNLVAPLGITTRLLLDGGLRAVGVCELPLVTLERFASVAGVPLRDVSFGYAGINHLGWFHDARAGDRDVLALASRDPARSQVDPRTLAAFGAAPLRYWYEVFARDAGARIGVARRGGRAAALEALSERALRDFEEGRDDALQERPTPWFDRALVPMMRAAWGGDVWEGFANVRNTAPDGGRYVGELPRASVVELPARVDAGGVHVRPPRPLPTCASRFLAAAGWSESLAYEAARAQDASRLREAVAALPLPLTTRAIDRLTEGARVVVGA